MFRVHLPVGVSLIGYADDVALTITGGDMQETQERLNLVKRRINLWMGEHGLPLAIPKTEIVLLTRRRISTDIEEKVEDGGNPHTIRAKTAVKYLGVLIWRPETEVPEMLRSPENWDKVAEYVRATLLAKKEEGFLL